mmetsp:Transcript_14305/g.37079  ORF Transcript_14305/g.37079 Transcript_14305/m.37079 type:complete len:252 (+) Transcript_14305:623-1378(+)
MACSCRWRERCTALPWLVPGREDPAARPERVRVPSASVACDGAAVWVPFCEQSPQPGLRSAGRSARFHLRRRRAASQGPRPRCTPRRRMHSRPRAGAGRARSRRACRWLTPGRRGAPRTPCSSCSGRCAGRTADAGGARARGPSSARRPLRAAPPPRRTLPVVAVSTVRTASGLECQASRHLGRSPTGRRHAARAVCCARCATRRALHGSLRSTHTGRHTRTPLQDSRAARPRGGRRSTTAARRLRHRRDH